MTKSSPTKARYNMQASAAGTTAGGSGSPSSSKLDIMLSYSGSSQSTGSTSIFPGMPKTPDRDNKNKVQHNWVGQPLIPRRITAKKKKKKVPRALNTGYISSDTSRDASIEQHHRLLTSEVPIRLQPRFSVYQDEDGTFSTTSSLTWENKTKDTTSAAPSPITIPSLDDKFWRTIDGGEETSTTTSSSADQKLYLKSNRKSTKSKGGSSVLENILENTPPHVPVPRGVEIKQAKKHYRDRDVDDNIYSKVVDENTTVTSELHSIASSLKVNTIHEDEEEESAREEHDGNKTPKKGRRKERTASDSSWTNLLSNLYNDSLDDIQRGCHADTIADLMNQGLLTTLVCDVQSWCQQQKQRQEQQQGRRQQQHDDGLVYSTKQDSYAPGVAHYVLY